MSVRVVIADDQALVRAGFRKILEADPGIEVIAEASDGVEAVQAAKTLRPDVVLMDIRMPNLDGLEAARRLFDADRERTRVLILTTFGLDEYVYEALRAGASGFLLKDAPPEDLLAAVRLVARGGALLDPLITRAFIEKFARRRPRADFAEKLHRLTPREHEILELLARGLSNAEIGQNFFVSEGTVKTHVANVLRKLELRDRVQAAIYAYEAGVVEPGTA